jgi:hypothetical protein
MGSMDWDAVTAIATTVSMIAFILTAVYIRGQLQHQEKERYLAITGELFAMWQSRDFMEAQLWVLHRLEAVTWEEFVRTHRADYGEAAFHRVGSFYDRVGTLVRRGLVDEEEILSTMGAYAIAVWQKIEPLVREARRIENSVLFDDFERLLPACYACYVPSLEGKNDVRPFQLSQPAARITAPQLRELVESGKPVTPLDVRVAQEIVRDPELLPGALRIPYSELESRAGELPREGELVTYCT